METTWLKCVSRNKDISCIYLFVELFRFYMFDFGLLPEDVSKNHLKLIAIIL